MVSDVLHNEMEDSVIGLYPKVLVVCSDMAFFLSLSLSLIGATCE